MSKFWFVFRVISFVVLVFLLVGGGVFLFNAGWMQGQASASLPAVVAGTANNAVNGYPYWGYGMHHMGYFGGSWGMGFGIIHFFIVFFLILLGVRLLIGLFGFGFGRHYFGRGRCWHHGHFHHHNMPPSPEEYNRWYQDWEKDGCCEDTNGEGPAKNG